MSWDIPTELKTALLTLRPYAPGDGAWLHEVYLQNGVHLSDSIEGLKAGLGFDVSNLHGAEQFVRQMTADWHLHKRFVFAVWENSSNIFIGDIWIECVDWELGIHEIGYFVVESHIRQGFATEATRAGLRFIFDDLHANKAGLTCDEDNVASYKVAERCGFVREGNIRATVKRTDEASVGKLHYGMLSSEFESLYR